MLKTPMENLDPDRFVFWMPPEGATIQVGSGRWAFVLPSIALPLHRGELLDGQPADAAIGQGVYDYLRQFPDCPGNLVYAELLRDAYPHFINDLASHAVMLDAKQVEPAYVIRKLICLKILCLLEPGNAGLLAQLCRGYFEVALEFSELARCRQHLLDSMRYGQMLLAVVPDEPQALSLLAEIDLLFGDAPAATDKWRRLAAQVSDPLVSASIESRMTSAALAECPESTLVDDLEAVAEAVHLRSTGDSAGAAYLLERIEEAGRLTSVFQPADFYWLLGVCRHDCGDFAGAVRSLHQALVLDPCHQSAKTLLDNL
jgi:hypothetical protein